MKIYFSVMGIGLGHMTRCLSIARNLRKEGFECIFSSYNRAPSLSRDEGYTTYESKPLMWYEDENGRLDLERTLVKGPLLFNRIASHFVDEYRQIKDLKPDMIVCDSRYSTIAASKSNLVPRAYITNQPRVYMPRKCNGNNSGVAPLEKLGSRFNYNLLNGHHRILLPDFPAPDSIAKRNMDFIGDAPECFVEKTSFVGPISYCRPGNRTGSEVEEVCNRYDLVPGEFTYIALSGPGKLARPMYDTICGFFQQHSIPSVVATGEPGSVEVKRKGNMRHVKGWIKDRDALLEAAGLVVCRAGLSTLSEIAAFGKKAIVIPHPNQPEQESNAEGLTRLGVAKSLSQDDVNPENLENLVGRAYTSNGMDDAAKRLREMASQWNGEMNSTKIILDMLENS